MKKEWRDVLRNALKKGGVSFTEPKDGKSEVTVYFKDDSDRISPEMMQAFIEELGPTLKFGLRKEINGEKK